MSEFEFRYCLYSSAADDARAPMNIYEDETGKTYRCTGLSSNPNWQSEYKWPDAILVYQGNIRWKKNIQ